MTSANGLKTATATDAFGTETTASLKAAAADLLIGAALPSGLTVSDLFTFLMSQKYSNADGSTTETTTNYASDWGHHRPNRHQDRLDGRQWPTGDDHP